MILNAQKIQVFTGPDAAGNTAVVCLCVKMPTCEERQAVALQYGAAASVFVAKMKAGTSEYRVHCHSPEHEIEFCGHGSMAGVFALHRTDRLSEAVRFNLLHETVVMRIVADGICELEKPWTRLQSNTRYLSPQTVIPETVACLEDEGVDIFVLKTADDVRNFSGPATGYRELGGKYLAVTAFDPEKNEVVSRYFSVGAEMREDAATGSLHCRIAPWWSEQLAISDLTYFQASREGARLECRVDQTKVYLRGKCIFYDSL